MGLYSKYLPNSYTKLPKFRDPYMAPKWLVDQIAEQIDSFTLPCCQWSKGMRPHWEQYIEYMADGFNQKYSVVMLDRHLKHETEF